MRGIILWAAVGLAAIVTGLGLYATALQTSPATITNPPVSVTPAADAPSDGQSSSVPSPSASSGSDDDRDRGGDDHDNDSDRDDDHRKDSDRDDD